MFKRIINHQGFWKSAIVLGVTFGVLFMIVKWALAGFSFVELNPTPRFFIGLIGVSFFYGFFMTAVKFRRKLKEEDAKNR